VSNTSKRAPKDEVLERIEALVEALGATPDFERFRAAEERLWNDPELTALQVELRERYEALQRAERRGQHDPRLFDAVRETQTQLQEHPGVVAVDASREAAQDLLRRVNDAMTAVLGVDVGLTAPRRSGGCC
jgi:cell fate (sporulation/competence/biofilm development) regulator YlbF (YheA/YmcA/DUF963 family)